MAFCSRIRFKFSEIEKFAFFEGLNDKCIEREGKGVLDLKKEGRYKLYNKPFGF
jgi:hypothetical protein